MEGRAREHNTRGLGSSWTTGRTTQPTGRRGLRPSWAGVLAQEAAQAREVPQEVAQVQAVVDTVAQGRSRRH